MKKNDPHKLMKKITIVTFVTIIIFWIAIVLAGRAYYDYVAERVKIDCKT